MSLPINVRTETITVPSVSKGNVLVIGLPTDGSYADGLVAIDENGTVADAVDLLNESAVGVHLLGSADHTADTLANLNAKVTDATLIDTADSRLSDDRTASGLRSATTVVVVSAAAAPTAGQVLAATSSAAAEWQNLALASGAVGNIQLSDGSGGLTSETDFAWSTGSNALTLNAATISSSGAVAWSLGGTLSLTGSALFVPDAGLNVGHTATPGTLQSGWDITSLGPLHVRNASGGQRVIVEASSGAGLVLSNSGAGANAKNVEFVTQGGTTFFRSINDDGTVLKRAFAMSHSSGAMEYFRDSTDTATLRFPFVVTHNTSAVAADGLGAGFVMRIVDDADVDNNIGSISTEREGADNSGLMRLTTYNSGVPVDGITIDSAQDVTIPNGDLLITAGALSVAGGTGALIEGSGISEIRRLTSNPAAIISVLQIKHTTSGNMVSGFGTGLTFRNEDPGASESIAIIAGVRGTNDDDGDLMLQTTTAGAGGLTTGLRIDQDQNVSVPNGSFTVSGGRSKTAKGANVASAGIMTLGTDGNFFDVTGTTTINEIVGTEWTAGTIIVLRFNGALTVTHNSGGTNDILLNGAVNFLATAGDLLPLIFDGTDWNQLAPASVI